MSFFSPSYCLYKVLNLYTFSCSLDLYLYYTNCASHSVRSVQCSRCQSVDIYFKLCSTAITIYSYKHHSTDSFSTLEIDRMLNKAMRKLSKSLKFLFSNSCRSPSCNEFFHFMIAQPMFKEGKFQECELKDQEACYLCIISFCSPV